MGGEAGYLSLEASSAHYAQNDLTALIIELTAAL